MHNLVPSLSREGWRKENNSVNCFLTTGESLLAGKLVIATRYLRYKPSDRSGVSEARAYEARRGGYDSKINPNFPLTEGEECLF